MIRIACTLGATCAAAIALASPAAAQDSRFAIGAQIGTPGGGVSALYSLSPNFVVRGSYDALQFDRDDSYSDIDYNAQLDFSSPGAFIDWHPTGNAFFVSAGAFLGSRDVNLDATPTTSTTIGGVSYTPAQIGNLNGKIELESTAPFVGLGYDNTFTNAGHWGFRLVAGAAFGDAPEVDLNASGGTLSNDPTFQARVRDEEANIQDDADNFKILPVVQAGLTYKF